MELTEQDRLPHVIDLLLRVRVFSFGGTGIEGILDAGQGSQMLEITEQDLALAVLALVVGLSGVCTAMELKVEFTVPCSILDLFVLGSLL